MEVAEKPLGSEGNVSFKVEGGKVKLALKHDHKSGSVSLVVEEDAAYFLDKLAEAIPGDWDRGLIEIVKGVVKGL